MTDSRSKTRFCSPSAYVTDRTQAVVRAREAELEAGVSTILTKLQVPDRVQAALKAREAGLGQTRDK